MANKIDSNVTGLRIAEELAGSPGVLPAAPVWLVGEPNEYGDFGGTVTTVARNPINPNRKRQKGTVTDLDASGGFTSDLTQRNMQELLQGFMFANLRRKGEAQNALGVTTLQFAAATLNSRITRSGSPVLDLTTQFEVGDLVNIAGFNNAANNGLFRLSAVTASTIDLSDADGTATASVLVDEAASGNVSIVQVGLEATAGDIDVDVSGSRPALTSTTVDFTSQGLVVGEWIFIGGDAADNQFTNAVNNGYARVRLITANRLEFDKTQNTMVVEASTAENIHLYFGRVLKDETGSDIVRRTYQMERELGASNAAIPANLQAEYVVGSIANTLNLNIPLTDKITTDLAYIGIDVEQLDENSLPTNFQRTNPVVAADAIKSASANLSSTVVSLPSTNALNTSSDFSRIKLATVNETDANPTPLFAFANEITLTINNNVSPNKAIGVLGAFDATVGTFEVGGSITAYFGDVAAVQAVRNNADVTLDAHIVENNRGVSIDVPLITLGGGQPNVTQDEPITIPLSTEAATGVNIDTNLDHTLLFVFFDYLPSLADD